MAFPLTMPSSDFLKVRFGLARNQAMTRDPYAQKRKVIHRQGDGWLAQFELPPLKDIGDRADWITFLVSCQGIVGTFYAFDPMHTTPRGSAAGTPLVDGASQAGTTLDTKGWDASETNILRKYDYFELESRYYQVQEDANSDGGGLSTLVFEPALRTAPADSAALTTTNPKCIMSLTDPDVFWDEEDLFVHGLSFTAEDSRE